MEKAIKRIGTVSQETVEAMSLIFREINAMNSSFAAVNQGIDAQASGGAHSHDFAGGERHDRTGAGRGGVYQPAKRRHTKRNGETAAYFPRGNRHCVRDAGRRRQYHLVPGKRQRADRANLLTSRPQRTSTAEARAGGYASGRIERLLFYAASPFA